MREFFILKTFRVPYYHMKPRSWYLVSGPDTYLIQKSSRLAMKRFHKTTKNLIFVYILNLYLFSLLV